LRCKGKIDARVLVAFIILKGVTSQVFPGSSFKDSKRRFTLSIAYGLRPVLLYGFPLHGSQRPVSEFRLKDIIWIKAHIVDEGIVKTQRLRYGNFCEEDGICEVLPDLTIVGRPYIAALQPFLGHS